MEDFQRDLGKNIEGIEYFFWVDHNIAHQMSKLSFGEIYKPLAGLA